MLISLWIYFVKVNFLLSCFYVLYRLCCKREKLLILNRSILLVSIILSFLTPTLNFSYFSFFSDKSFQDLPLDYFSSKASSKTVIPIEIEAPILASKHIITKTNVLFFFTICYAIVATLFVLRFLKRSYHVIRIIQTSKKQRLRNVIYCEPENICTPFSYFKYIVINKQLFTALQYDHIVKHEEAHCKQWHSIDLTLMEIIQALFWINPLIILLKQDLRLNLEFLADDYAISQETSVKAYQYALLHVSTRREIVITNHFAQSNVKQRITMINRDRPKRAELLRYSAIVPGFIVLILSIQFFQSKAENGLPAYNEMSGYYQSVNSAHVFLHVSSKNGHLILEPLWDNNRVAFKQKGQLEFYNPQKNFHLKFIKDKKGAIKQLLAFEKDLWNKVEDDRVYRKKEIELSAEQLKSFEARYQYKNEPYYIDIKSEDNAILVNESWTGNSIRLFPETPLRFFSRQNNYTLEFIRNSNGKVVKAIALSDDEWHKISN